MGCLKLTYCEPKEAPEVIANFFGNALEKNAPEPFFCLNAYTYGFQGMQRTDEWSGSGNHYTAPNWEYSPRLGRRWNTDPVFYPWQSSYATFNNNPIYYTDPSGLEAKGPGKRTLWQRLTGKTSTGQKHMGKTGFKAWFKNFFQGIGDLFNGKRNKSKNQNPTDQGPPPGWKSSIPEVVISAERPRVPFKRGYITLTTPNAPSQSVRTWSDAPDRFPEGHWNAEGVEAMTSLSGRSMDLPSYIFHPWEFIANLTSRIVGAFKAYYNDEARMKSTTDKDVEKQAEKAAEDYNEKKKPKKQILREFNDTRDTIREIEVDVDDPYNERGEGDTLRSGIDEFNN
ncbi:MAG: hypothetical protein CMC96_08035 [Flavobacteriales bacterium]|nr:hypothetical protein [Flavobacteriales bacterium]|tara:strand:+ start:49074 stop:50093 length:1020 start_codon:yes stop_codon:yes gene_type:complete